VVTPGHGSVGAGAAPASFAINSRLSGSINLALTDGHVDGVPLEQLWTYYWNVQWVVPNPRPK
jgi:hypothetical protein